MRSSASGTLRTDRTFTGQKSDATGLLYYNARYYDPALGTFISPDTLVPDPGMVVDYNRFLYAKGNPLKYSDPSGYIPTDLPEYAKGTPPGADPWVADFYWKNRWHNARGFARGADSHWSKRIRPTYADQELTMGKTSLHRLFNWRPSAKFGCLSVFIFCGLLTGCPIAYLFQGLIWEAPSIEIRNQVNADLSSCILKESELPSGWIKRSPLYFPLKSPNHPVPTGMLGGAFTLFSYDKPGTHIRMTQELKLYERLDQAMYYYVIRRIGYPSTRYRKWKPHDLSHANLSADAYNAKCFNHMSGDGRVHEEKTCEIKARYDKFVSILEANVSNQGMSMEEYIQVLRAIDRHMLQCVDAFADKTWEEE